MNNILAIRKEQLPDNINGLKNFIIIGEGVLKAHRSQLNIIKKIGVAQNYYNAKLYDGQSVAKIVLEAQGKLGRVLEDTVKPRGNTSLGYQGRTKTLPPTITKKESHIAQSISKNPDVVKKVIEKAKENREIPTTRDVLEEIQVRIKKAHRKKPEPLGKIVQPKDRKYKTLVIDPPWPIKKIERNERPNQGIELDYPIMSIDEIKALAINKWIDPEGCHVYLWTTQKYLPIAFEILKEWGFNYIFTMVWHKKGGFQPFNLPQYNCEFIVFGKRGSLDFLTTKNFFTCFNGRRREHSRKPNEFYDKIRKVSPEPLLDMFSREKHKGFDSLGDEINKYDKS